MTLEFFLQNRCGAGLQIHETAFVRLVTEMSNLNCNQGDEALLWRGMWLCGQSIKKLDVLPSCPDEQLALLNSLCYGFFSLSYDEAVFHKDREVRLRAFGVRKGLAALGLIEEMEK
jgi:hypothetical protein